MKFVCHKENFSNFVFGEHSDYCLYYFVIEHYKGTTIFANHQIYRQLYFIELTLNKSEKLKTISWIGGAILVTGGVITFLAGGGVSENNIVGASLGIGAVAGTTTFLLLSNHEKKKAPKFDSSSIYQHDFNLPNGFSLSVGLDMINDHSVGEKALGLGLRYNF